MGKGKGCHYVDKESLPGVVKMKQRLARRKWGANLRKEHSSQKGEPMCTGYRAMTRAMCPRNSREASESGAGGAKRRVVGMSGWGWGERKR